MVYAAECAQRGPKWFMLQNVHKEGLKQPHFISFLIIKAFHRIVYLFLSKFFCPFSSFVRLISGR